MTRRPTHPWSSILVITLIMVLVTPGIAGATDSPSSTAPTQTPTEEVPGDAPQVYGGTEVSNPGWIAAVFDSGSFICTASLIAPSAILTAAHCVDSGGPFQVKVGEEYLYSPLAVTRTVSQVYIHPGWTGAFNDPDLAVLALSAPILTLPLATLNTEPAWPVLGQDVTVTGWGQTYDGGPPSDYLQAAALAASSGMDGSYDKAHCDLDPDAMVPGGTFCYGGGDTDPAKACFGDSGGPLVGWSSPSASSGDVHIYGLVSYGPAFCGPSLYDGKAQAIGGHTGWIDSVVSWIEDPTVESGADSIVVYDASGPGTAFIVDVHPSGRFTPVTDPSGAVPGADVVGTAYLGGPLATVDDLLFYSTVTGEFDFASVTTPDAKAVRDIDVFTEATGTRGWTHVVTGDYNGDGTGDLLFYRSSDGLLRFYTTTPTGVFTALTPAYFGTTGWTHLVVGDYDGDGKDDVMWYRAGDGLLRFYEVTSTGEFHAITPAYFGTRRWSSIPSGDFDGNGTDDLLFYRDDGLARFYEVDASGAFRALGAAFAPSPGFGQVEAAELTPATPGADLVWYHPLKDTLLATRYAVDTVSTLWDPMDTEHLGEALVIRTGRFPG